jgi:pyruvate/2-oxoglutarate dehydrogenase complex dihydrolipoamide acyltransferase (E2) component
VAEERANEALEKLHQGIRKSKQMVQLQTMELAQEYFGDSMEALKQLITESRATLRDLPKQIPGGEEEPFRMLFQVLMDNYTAVEESLNEAQDKVADLDIERLRKKGELDATDAARREARERGVDLTELEGTGSGGRITIDDVRDAAEGAAHEAAGEKEDGREPKISDAARRKAEKLGIDVRELEGTGSGGLITVKDVTNLLEGAKGKANGKEEVADDLVRQNGEEEGPEQPEATNAAKRKAEDLGIDLRELEGTGSGGLITIQDVLSKA